MTFANAESATIKDRQILVIMTNHASYPSRTDTTGLWLTELTHFTDVVEAAGYTTVFASPKGGAVPLDERSLGWLYMDKAAREHLQSPAFRARLANTLPIAEVDPSRFGVIYFGSTQVLFLITGEYVEFSPFACGVLALSLLFHALLLSLTFGGQGLGLPGFGFPWQDRRADGP